jgi:hypothetical protein
LIRQATIGNINFKWSIKVSDEGIDRIHIFYAMGSTGSSAAGSSAIGDGATGGIVPFPWLGADLTGSANFCEVLVLPMIGLLGGADPTGGSELVAVPGWSSRIMSFG